MTEIKRIIQRIYDFDYSKCDLEDGTEFIATEHGNEFTNTFICRDLDKGIIVTPSEYVKGLVYTTKENGYIYNPSTWIPDIVNFAFNIYGLKKNAYYRITVKAKNMNRYNNMLDVTDDRGIEIINNATQELLMKHDISEQMTFADYSVIFKANSVEENLHFRIGKIGIKDIIIDEVELLLDENLEEETTDEPTVEFDSGKSNIVAYAAFSCDCEVDTQSKYTEMPKTTGKGLNLYYDKSTMEYILERDNYEDTIQSAFTNANYVVDFCFTKAPYASYMITGLSNDVSPNTLKQGYIRFKIIDMEKNEPVKYSRPHARLSFLVRKIL